MALSTFAIFPIALLVSIGTSYSPKLAAGGFHSQAGWITFIVLALAIIAVTHRVRFFVSLREGDVDTEINPIAAALRLGALDGLPRPPFEL